MTDTSIEAMERLAALLADMGYGRMSRVLRALLAERDALRAAAKDCADDLEKEFQKYYPAEVDQMYSGERLDYERGMEVVRRVRELLKGDDQ